MKIAITGAGGRLGRALIPAALAAGHEIVAIDRDEPERPTRGVTSRPADVTDYADLEGALAGCDALIHLAAYTNPSAQPEPLVHHNNVTASYNVLRAAQVQNILRVCLASSVNAIGGVYSGEPRYDYFPVDEQHPRYPEDAYSLSKLIAEEQAAAFARRVPGLSAGCLRLHALRERAEMARRLSGRPDFGSKDLWGYTSLAMATRACLATIGTDLGGCEVFNVVAPDTYSPEPSRELRDHYYPRVPLRGDFSGHCSFYDSAKAKKVLQCLPRPRSRSRSGPPPRSARDRCGTRKPAGCTGWTSTAGLCTARIWTPAPTNRPSTATTSAPWP
jgi:nucleoside-diphosphate-sugar epimerase